MATHPSARAYLQEAYGVSYVGQLETLPVFCKDNQFWLGGYKQLYSVLPTTDAAHVASVLVQARAQYPLMHAYFSAVTLPMRHRMAHGMLSLASCTTIDERFGLYSKKTRNQVRKSYKNTLQLGDIQDPGAFYALYRESMQRLGSRPKPPEWFATFERHFGADVWQLGLFDRQRLVGSNYAVRNGAYALLLFNVSDPAYWSYDVNNRLYDAFIVRAWNAGVRWVDFGMGTVADQTHVHFKEGFGAQFYPLCDTFYGPRSARMHEWAREKWFALRMRFHL